MRASRFVAIAALLFAAGLPAQDTTRASADTGRMTVAEFEASLAYRTGTIVLKDSVATLQLPPGFRYLNPADAERVLVQAWGNPPGGGSLGMIIPPGMGVTDSSAWAVIVSYDEDGYVKDDEAAKLDYDKLLREMQGRTQDGNKERAKAGYAPIRLIGWAARPHYDARDHKIYWAKELQFGDETVRTLNYDIRVLGRRGVLVLSAVATMPQLATIERDMQQVLGFSAFNEGQRYADFAPGTDRVAAYGIAALVAGGIAGKAGFFKLLLAGLLAAKKFLVIAVVGAWAAIKRFFTNRRSAGGAAS